MSIFSLWDRGRNALVYSKAWGSGLHGDVINVSVTGLACSINYEPEYELVFPLMADGFMRFPRRQCPATFAIRNLTLQGELRQMAWRHRSQVDLPLQTLWCWLSGVWCAEFKTYTERLTQYWPVLWSLAVVLKLKPGDVTKLLQFHSCHCYR